MPRKKQGPAAVAAADKADRRVRGERRVYSIPASDNFSTTPEAPLPPALSSTDYRTQHLANLRTTVEAGLTPLPDDQDDDLTLMHKDQSIKSPTQDDDYVPLYEDEPTKSFKEDYVEKMDDLRRLWDKIGFYTHHPNHNAANASEDELKEMLESHPTLGPVLKQYKLYLNPPKMRSFLLQFPTRQPGQEYRALYGNKPIELRIKPKCGLVEIDVALDIHHNYDHEKGIEYGRALRNSRTLQQGGSYGLAGGFGVGVKPTKDDRRPPQSAGPSVEKLLENVDDANNKGYMMNKITLGGQIVPFEEGEPIYMVATFRDDICTWTKLDAIVELRPEFGHLDALREQEKPGSRQEPAFEEKPTDKSTDKSDEKEAKAVNMTVKSSENDDDDEDSDLYGRMRETAKLLKAIRDEPWQRLTWVDQDDDESFEVYDENLVYQDPENAPHLVSELTEEQYLDAFSCPRFVPPTHVKNVMGDKEESTHSNEDEDEDDEESELDLEDTEDEEDEEEEEVEKLPPGVIRPDDRVLQRRIEVLCRIICSKPPKKHGPVEQHLRKKLQGKADHRFLNPHNVHNRYYKWRLAENKAGRGYAPEDDLPRLVPGALE